MRKLNVGVVSVCFVICTVVAALGEDYSRSARIDSSVWKYKVGENSAIVDVHSRITILDAVGKSFGDILAFENAFSKVTLLEFTVSDASGKVIRKGSKKDLVRHCGYGGSNELYSDACSYYFEPSAPAYPYTVVSTVRNEYNSLFFLPAAYALSRVPTGYFHVELTYSPKNPVTPAFVNLTQPQNEWKGTTTPGYTWTIHNLPAMKEVAYLPPDVAEGRYMTVTPSWFKLGDISVSPLNWRNFGHFYKDLAESRYLVVPATPTLSRNEALETAARICTETAREIRYVAVSIGLSGWQPEAALKTQSLGYGDCKGVTTLLVSRLRQAGIAAIPCLVKTADTGPLDTTVVEHGFNHVITMMIISPDTLFFDATCQTCPFGVLPEVDQGIVVLAVTDTGGVLVKTPTITADRNLITRQSSLTVDDSNCVTIEAVHTLSGQYAENWRSYLNGDDSEDRRLKMQAYFFRGRSHLTLTNYTISQLDSISVPLQIKGAIRSSQSNRPISGVRYLLPFETIAKSIFDDLDLKDRTQPIDLDLPRTILDSIRIVTPWTARCDSVTVPPSDSVQFDAGSTSVLCTRAGDTIRVVLTQVYNQRVVPTEGFAKFGEYIRARRKLLDRPIRWYGSY